MSLDTADAAYIAKLKESKRDKKLIAAFILLLLALRRLRPRMPLESIAVELAPATTLLASRIAAYVARQMQTSPELTRTITGPLLKEVSRHAAEALKLAPAERTARLGLIAQAEIQRATMAAAQRLADKRTLIREVHSNNPCPRCLSLEGTYSTPYPDDVWYWHPRCACSWRVVTHAAPL